MRFIKGLVFSLLLLLWLGVAQAQIALPDFTQLVEQSAPAVVNISTTLKKPDYNNSRYPGLPRDHKSLPPQFDEWFHRFFGDQSPGGNAKPEPLGSGFIISSDGYVLTNSHVIRDAEEIIVRLSDRREFVATVVGEDRRSDVALLKIDAVNLPIVEIGRSSEVKVGSWVLAIGSPFGFEHSVTAGIVSAIGRSLPNENYVPFIQTDVAINPGNSGGPLFNLDGEVIGINAQIYSRTGGFMGLSFAVPIDMAMNAVRQLKTTGYVKRGWLGILVQDVTRELAASFAMQKPGGALVARVLPAGPAEKAGLKVGDVIVTFNNDEVPSSAALPPMVGATPVGDEIKLNIIRHGKQQTLTIIIAELPDDDALALNGGNHDVVIERLSITVADLGTQHKEMLEDNKGGVVVSQLERGLASQSGIRMGDIIQIFSNVQIEDGQQLAALVEATQAGDTVPVLVQRQSGPVFIAIRFAAD